MSSALSKAFIKMALSSTPCFGFTAPKLVWLLRLIPFVVTLSLTPRTMDKILKNLKLDLAHHVELAEHWNWLAQRQEISLTKRLRRLANAMHHEKMACEITAEINGWK